MRARVVLIVMSVAVVILGAVVVLNGLISKEAANRPENGNSEGVNAPLAGEAAPTTPVQTTPGKGPITNLVATTPDEDREAAIDQELDQLKEALLNGESDPTSVEIVRARFLHSEADVRKAAYETAMHLNDRAAIPKLKEALAKVQDPREKVIIMDAIEYLKIPDIDMGQIVSNAAEVLSDNPSASATLIPKHPTVGREPAAPPKQ